MKVLAPDTHLQQAAVLLSLAAAKMPVTHELLPRGLRANH